MPSPLRSSTFLALSALVLTLLTLPVAGEAAKETGAAGSEIFQSPRTAVQLVAEQRSVRAGEPLRIGLRFDLTEHWHVYWRNPGDSGTAPMVEWELPEGWSAGEFQWPVPKRIPVGPFVNFGYEGEIVLPVLLDPGSIVSGGASADAPDRWRVVADAEWLVCREECIPESARFTLELPVAEGDSEPSRWAPLFAEADARQPVEVPGVASSIRDLGDGTLKLEVEYPSDLDLASSEIDFFPADPTAVEHAAAVEVEASADAGDEAERRLTLTLQRSPYAASEVQSLDGVLVASSREPRDERSVALVIEARAPRTADTAAAGGAVSETAEGADAVGAGRPGVAAALGLAFLGGVLLNLMPCVFPVLSIKILGLVGHREDPAAGRRHGLLFAAGILVSFWVLAGA
ncbi:MAG: protein-disulfide reductase DsbD family protein, partial [Acidobacteriota bacterium]|nr:protein-disulfide reductase DsbD family protein [Acidobacteriota bacterium]